MTRWHGAESCVSSMTLTRETVCLFHTIVFIYQVSVCNHFNLLLIISQVPPTSVQNIHLQYIPFSGSLKIPYIISSDKTIQHVSSHNYGHCRQGRDAPYISLPKFQGRWRVSRSSHSLKEEGRDEDG